MRKFLNIIIFALYLACASKAYAKNYVVCVGISDYPGYMNDLTVSHRDASYIANVFRRNGNAEVHCLLNKNATVSNVVNTMRSVYQKAGADDAVILFFSGHGDKGAFRCYNAPMSYSAITQSMKLSHSRKRIVFADACMSGSMRNNNRKGGDESIDIMFFLLVFLAALTSNISLTETCVGTLSDELGWSRRKSTLVFGVYAVLLGSLASLGYGVLGNLKIIGMQVLDFLDFISQFSRSAEYRISHVAPSFDLVVLDPDTYEQVKGNADASQWDDYAPELPTDKLALINYGGLSSTNSERIVQLTSMEEGMSSLITFRKQGGKWKAVKLEND